MFSSRVARGWSARRGVVRGRRSRGQVIVLFALMGLVVIGLAGLALDGGQSYMNKSTLQSADDNASLAGTHILAVDYDCYNDYTDLDPVSSSTLTCLQSTGGANEPAGGQAPYGFSDLQNTVQSVLASYSNGALVINSVAYLVDNSTPQPQPICWFYATGAAPASPPKCIDPAIVSGADWYDACTGVVPCPAAHGVRVNSSETHATSLMRLLGVAQASETTTATAKYSPGVAGGAPFAAFYLNCFDNPQDQIYLSEDITYHLPPGKKGFGCSGIGDANFKGCLRKTQPNPFNVPSWIASKSGNGCNFPYVAAGEQIQIPLIDCLALDAECTEPASFGTCRSPGNCYPLPAGAPPPPPFCSTTSTPSVPPYSGPTNGYDVMCVFGWVTLQADKACRGNGNTCTGTVIGFPTDSEQPTGSVGAGTTVVQLYE